MGLLDGITPTAIKTVTDDSDDAKLNALLSEVKVIAYVGSHKNVTQLLGVQLVDLRTGMQFRSFPTNLDLYIHFLSMNISNFVYRSDICRCRVLLAGFIKRVSNKTCNELRNLVSFYKSQEYMDPLDFVKPLSRYELLRWCHQISNAMEFLGSKKVQNIYLVTVNQNSITYIVAVKLSPLDHSR